MSAAVPESTLTSEQLLKLANFRREDADALDSAFLESLAAFSATESGLVPASGGGSANFLRADGTWSPIIVGAAVIDVTAVAYGAVGDGVTDDRAAIQLAADAAVAQHRALYFPAGTYKLSGAIVLNGAHGVEVVGTPGAVLRYPSDDTGVTFSGIMTADYQARSAFYLLQCSNVRFVNLTFTGGDAQNLSDNIGCGVYVTHGADITLQDCIAINGGSLFGQDATSNTAGTGDSLAVATGVVTITDAAGLFSAGHVGRRITIAGSTNRKNDGAFAIASYVSATQVTYTNAAAIAETSSFAWSIEDGDTGTILLDCHSQFTRNPITTGPNAKIIGGTIERPTSTIDAAGIGDVFTLASTTVTLTDAAGRFLPSHHGKIVTVAGATSGANDGAFRITYINSQQISWTNAAGVAEYFTGNWWIANGERAGFGAGVGAQVFAAGYVTLTAAESAFASTDVGKCIRLEGGCFPISEYISATQVKYENAGGSSASFSGLWTVDSYDRAALSGDTVGSTHGIYIFAGRSNILVDGVTFKGIRTTCVKASGSSAPIRNVIVRNCFAQECGEFFVAGADDNQEHTGLICTGNTLLDCGTGSPGRSAGVAIQILGARGVEVSGNGIHYTRNAIGYLDTRGIAGNFGIQAASGGLSGFQPIEDVTIANNKFTKDPTSAAYNGISTVAIDCQYVGLSAKYNTGGQLTKAGDIMTMTDNGMQFTAQDIGRTLELYGSDAGNDGTFTIVTVPSSTSVQYVNAGGTGSNSWAGMFRMYSQYRNVGGCLIAHNQIISTATVSIYTRNCYGPEVVHNLISSGGIYTEGDVTPRIQFNRELTTHSQPAKIRIFDGTSWPIISDNTITNQGGGGTEGYDFGVGDSGGTMLDWPLLGVRGRAMPTNGKQECVVAYGSNHVDGDWIAVNGTQFFYKGTAPGAGQFNSLAGLVALIDAMADISCADYGSYFTDAVVTRHLKISWDISTATADQLSVQISALVPTALVLLRNGTSRWLQKSRGVPSAGPTADKTVVWSPLCSFQGGPVLVADNAAAMTLLQTGGYRTVKNIYDAGCCEVVNHGADAGTEEFRWSLR